MEEKVKWNLLLVVTDISSKLPEAETFDNTLNKLYIDNMLFIVWKEFFLLSFSLQRQRGSRTQSWEKVWDVEY